MRSSAGYGPGRNVNQATAGISLGRACAEGGKRQKMQRKRRQKDIRKSRDTSTVD